MMPNLDSLLLRFFQFQLERQSIEHDQDHMLYNMLNSLGKLLRDCNQVIRDKKWRDNMNVIWGMIYILFLVTNRLSKARIFGMKVMTSFSNCSGPSVVQH